ncbi:MAG: NusG domain II-containing protein [Oscillospiraceae bacterium]|nr:NusG domain II-containing protein [Oscillospiraceae bacterium]
MNWLKTRKNDVLLAAALLLLGGALALFLLATRREGGTVRVQIDGETVMELPLDQDARLVLGEGEGTNTLTVSGGTAQIVQADCPDQVCVRQGAVRYAGESIVCLPHRLIVTIEGGAAGGIDGSTG